MRTLKLPAKLWAVVNKKGRLIDDSDELYGYEERRGQLYLFNTKEQAMDACDPRSDERVVRVVVQAVEAKGRA